MLLRRVIDKIRNNARSQYIVKLVDAGYLTRCVTEPRIAVCAELDVPGETRKQTLVFLVWIVSLFLAVTLGSIAGHRVRNANSLGDDDTVLSQSRHARSRIGLIFGLIVPSVLTFVILQRYRRGGKHARAITIDITQEGEFRIWGRSYGSRIDLANAEITERLVDVYAGRLGEWRQRRICVRSTHAGSQARSIEIATRANKEDEMLGLRLEGGEGNCIEVSRASFEAIRKNLLNFTNRDLPR